MLLACASLTGGCATGSTGRVLGASPDGHARQLQAQVRAAAQDVLPALVRALHGTVPAVPARFVGCQVDGLWRYEARGEVHEPAGSPGDVARLSFDKGQWRRGISSVGLPRIFAARSNDLRTRLLELVAAGTPSLGG